MGTWLASWREAFTTKLWPIPTIAVVTALLLGLGIPELDAAVDDQVSGRASAWLFGGDADAARSLLGAIASSLITVTALTFSLTVVTLQLASSQFSPRLLRTFSSDHFVQLTLALFLATFTYALTVLRSVRGGDGSQVELVPQIAVSLAFLLAVASVLGLVLFLAHLVKQIRVETMLSQVRSDASGTLRSVLTKRDPAERDHAAAPSTPAGALSLLAHHDGFLAWVDHDRLRQIALNEDVVVSVQVQVGDYLVRGTPLGEAWPMVSLATLNVRAGHELPALASQVADCLHTASERTSTQDVGFGLRQLVDVANKALSPGINDPTTAIHALGHISSLLCELSDRALGPLLLRDDDERVRVVVSRPDFASLLDLGISQPRRYGAGDPQLVGTILTVLLDLSHRVSPDQRPVVHEQLQRVRATASAQGFDLVERRALDVLAQQVEVNLAGVGQTGE